jgi:hypothetical protein
VRAAGRGGRFPPEIDNSPRARSFGGVPAVYLSTDAWTQLEQRVVRDLTVDQVAADGVVFVSFILVP